MEPIYIIPKAQFLAEIEKKLKHVTHIAVPVERNEIYGLDPDRPNGVTIVGVGIDVLTAGGVAQMLDNALKAPKGYQYFCNDKKFMKRVKRHLEEQQKLQTEAQQHNNQMLADLAHKLQSPLISDGERIEAAMSLIQDAIAQHEAKKRS